MPPITGLDVRLNGDEFSRFEEDKKVIKARVLPAADDLSALAETVTVELYNKHDVAVASVDLDFTGDFSNGKGKIAEFDISVLKHTDGYTPFIHGNGYYARAKNADDSVNASASFRVAIVTVAGLRKSYCGGAPLYSSEIKTAKKQPSLITGLTIIKVNERVKTGLHTFIFIADDGEGNSTIQFDSGAVVTLDPNITSELLPDDCGGYVEVEIDHFELPDSDQTEGIFIDLEEMSASTIREEIDKSVAELENVLLKVDIEPKRFASVPYFDGTVTPSYDWFDKKVDALPYYRKDFNVRGRGWHLSLPVQQLLEVESLIGQIGNVAHLSITKGAYVPNRVAGTVDVLPYDSQYAHLYQFFVQLNFWGIREFIEGFWRYEGVCGVEDTPMDLVKAVAYSAAIPILTVAGQAYRAGFSSESNSKDGVSRSVSYTSSAVYGIYSATINQYEKWLKENMKKMRGTYKGLTMVVI